MTWSVVLPDTGFRADCLRRVISSLALLGTHLIRFRRSTFEFWILSGAGAAPNPNKNRCSRVSFTTSGKTSRPISYTEQAYRHVTGYAVRLRRAWNVLFVHYCRCRERRVYVTLNSRTSAASSYWFEKRFFYHINRGTYETTGSKIRVISPIRRPPPGTVPPSVRASHPHTLTHSLTHFHSGSNEPRVAYLDPRLHCPRSRD